MKRLVLFALASGAIFAVAGCGSSGDTTTVVKEIQPETVERTTTVEVPAPEPKAKPASHSAPAPEPEPEAVPDVVGLPLDVAEELFKKAGYKAAATNTDTTFGIMVPANYTICTQDDARGTIVPVLAQKYGC
jgi:hypothetical protein